MEKEKIICSAIWFDDYKEYQHQPKNIKTGFVICGRRHHNCFMIMKILTNSNYTKLDYEKEQGFLTNTNRFVDREEAAVIAKEANQTNYTVTKLYSEDLY